MALERNINNIPDIDLGKKDGKISVMQADSVLAFRRVNKISDIVFSSDSDLLAHAGEESLGIKTYNYISRGKKAGIDAIEIFTSDRKMLQYITSALHKLPDDKDIKISKNGIFDGILCPRIRAMMAIGLGCDIMKSGIRGITKVVLREWLNNNKHLYNDSSLLHDKLLLFFEEQFHCDIT